MIIPGVIFWIWTVERVISMCMRTGWCGQSIYHNVLSAKALGIPLRNGSSDRQVNILEETLYLRVSRIPLSPRKGNCNFYRGLSLARLACLWEVAVPSSGYA